jgi:hypothetical protein
MNLRLNPQLEIQAVRVTDDHLCVMIDDFLLNPRDAVDFAAAQAGSFEQQERAYPGLVLPVSNEPLAAMNRFIQMEMSRLFSFCRGDMQFFSQFSLTTLQPEQFTWIQRLCHTDPRLAPGRVNYAALLYLFENPDLGGTGFYRWKDPAFWQEMTALQRDDPAAGLDILKERFEMFREPARYMTESNEAAELLDKVSAKFNRLVFYSGELPHSAWITQPELLSSDPRQGRLTLNCFVSAVAKR